MRKILLFGIALAMIAAPVVVSAQRPAGHPPVHVTGSRPVFGGWHAAPPVSHSIPPARPPQRPQPRPVPNNTVHGTPYYRGTTHYAHPGAYNPYYARHPNMYPGSWVYTGGRRWYNGYWHSYWARENWVWFGGFYGFWFPLNFITVFVYEEGPGVCEYWDGYEWVPYYDPDTGYYCPY
jgi:hypothetical protein